VGEFEALTGERYFEGGWTKVTGTMNGRGAARAIPLDTAIRRWCDLIALCPDFPGRDDAGLHLARCQEEAGRPREALLTLLAARSWGDQDARFAIEDRIACVLDAQLPLEDTLDLARTCEPRALLAYAAAVKLARAHRFEEALVWLDRVEQLFLGGAWQQTKPEHITEVILRALRSGPETCPERLPRTFALEREEANHGR
jgi:hypothetical protein